MMDIVTYQCYHASLRDSAVDFAYSFLCMGPEVNDADGESKRRAVELRLMCEPFFKGVEYI
jgi:hypothetical protein